MNGTTKDLAISINNFTKNFGKQKAVNGLNLNLERGKILAFLGANGSGKTTTIRCLLRIYPPTKGTLKIFGSDYSDKLISKVGYLPEERGIYTRVTVIELLKYFANLRNVSKENSTKFIDQYLERVGLSEHKNKKISQLSSGMQQKVQIGVTILHKPQLLILDEPYKGLDPVNRNLFSEIFQELNKEGSTILYSTHVVDEAEQLATDVLILKEGVTKASGEIQKVRESFGSKQIKLNFSGKITKSELFTLNEQTKNTVIIKPNENVNQKQIIQKLNDMEDLKINEFKVDRPSLKEIFLKINEK